MGIVIKKCFKCFFVDREWCIVVPIIIFLCDFSKDGPQKTHTGIFFIGCTVIGNRICIFILNQHTILLRSHLHRIIFYLIFTDGVFVYVHHSL